MTKKQEIEESMLSVESIAMNEWNGNRKPDKEFIASVKEKGILQPILVRPLTDENAKGNSAAYQVVCGSRRLQAAVAAGLERIPAIVRVLTDEQAREATLIENIQRQDMTPLEEADAVKLMLETKDAKDVATSIGRSKRYVAECRRIAESLTPGAKKEITRKGFPVVPRECLALIASIPWREQLRFIENVEDHGAHLLADADWVRSSIFEEMAPLGDDCPFSQTDEGLAPEAGPCTTCPKRTGADQDLFGGIFAKADKCGDPACYAAKLETHANRAIEEALKKNPDAKKGFISTFLTSEGKGELAKEADEIQEYAWGRGLCVCKKKDDGAVKYVLIYPLAKAGKIVYARKGGARASTGETSDGEAESGRMKGPEMLKRRRLAWMLKALAENIRNSKGLSGGYDSDEKVLELVSLYGAPASWGQKKGVKIRHAVFEAMAGGIATQELSFNLVSNIDPIRAEKAMKRVLSYVDDNFEDSYNELAQKAAEEVSSGRKKKE